MAQHKRSTLACIANFQKAHAPVPLEVVDQVHAEVEIIAGGPLGIEKEKIWLQDADEHCDYNHGGDLCKFSDTSSVVGLDCEDEPELKGKEEGLFNGILSGGMSKWVQKEKEIQASWKRPQHYTKKSDTTAWRNRKKGKNNGNLITPSHRSCSGWPEVTRRYRNVLNFMYILLLASVQKNKLANPEIFQCEAGLDKGVAVLVGFSCRLP